MKSHSPIGLDLGAHTIKAVQFDQSGELLASASIRRANPGTPICEDDVIRIAGALYRGGFAGRRVAISAPKAMVHRLTLDLPPLDSGAPIDQIAQTELCRQRLLEPGTFEYRWFESPQPPRHASGVRAIALSCTHEDADSILDLFETSGFLPVSLRSPDVVLAEAILNAESSAAAAILDLGWTDATFVVVRGGEIRYTRAIPGCGLGELAGQEEWFAATLGSALRRSLASEPSTREMPLEFSPVLKRYLGSLATELASSLDYLEGCGTDEAPRSLTLTGGGTGIPGLCDSLKSETGLAIHELINNSNNLCAIAASLAKTPDKAPAQEAAA